MLVIRLSTATFRLDVSLTPSIEVYLDNNRQKFNKEGLLSTDIAKKALLLVYFEIN